MKILVFILLLIAFTQAFAQHMPYINYTSHHGLPHIQAQSLFQDSKGYIWVGTKGGIAKFNGEKFSNYLQNQYITKCTETVSGDIIVASREAVYWYNKGVMQQILQTPKPSYICAGDSTYFVISNDEIKEYIQNKLINTYYKEPQDNKKLFELAYCSLTHQIYFLERGGQVYTIKNKELAKISSLPAVISLHNFPNGKAYATTYDSSSNTYNAIDLSTRNIYFSYKIFENNHTKFSINEIPCNNFIFNHYEIDSTYLISNYGKEIKALNLPYIKKSFSFIIDRDNNYWAATDNGIYQISNGPILTFPRTFMNDFWTIIKGKDNNFYGASYLDNLYRLDMEKQQKKTIYVPGLNNKPETHFYYSASIDKAGSLYFPTQNGLVKYNYIKAKKLNNGITITSRYDSVSDRIIFGQENGFAFINQKEETEVFIDSTKKLIPSRPSFFEFKQNGDIWIGTWQRLLLYKRNTKTLHFASDVIPTAPDEGINAMTNDFKNNTWMGGTNHLFLYDSEKDSFSQIGEGLFNNYILALKTIGDKYLIVGTSFEIFIFDLKKIYKDKTLVYKMYNFRNGFVSEEIAENGFFVDDSKIYIPSITLTSVIDIDKIKFDNEFYDILITHVNDSGLTNQQQKGKIPIELEYGKNKLEIQFETVGFGLPTQNSFSYKLEGKDSEWSNWTNKQSVLYSNLSSGTYTFKVKAKNYYDPIKESKVLIRISLPFYREPHFYRYAFFIVSLLTILSVYFVYRWYKTRMQALEQERKIKYQEVATLQAQITPHFIFNFLSSVQGLINRREPEKANEYLVKFSNLMRAYMESSIKNSKILSGAIVENETTIGEEIEMIKTYIELEKMKYPDEKISYQILYSNPEILDQPIPPFLIQPFVENAIKHGILPSDKPGEVKISYEVDNDVIYCYIEDNGIGREKSHLRKQISLKDKKSRGIQLIKDRIEILNQLGYNIHIAFEDLAEGGTKVKITLQS